MKNFLLVCAKVLFFLFCIVVAFALFVVSAYFSIQFYKYGLPESTLEAKNTILIITVLAISVEVIKFVLSFTAPLIKHRDEEADAKISFALTVALILSILASLTYFLIVHETYSPTARIVNLFYETFLVPIGFDVCRTQIIFIFNCIFSVLIEYFIILLPAISTLPFRPRLSSLTGKKSNFVMLSEVFSSLTSKPITAIHRIFVKPVTAEIPSKEIKEEPFVRNLDNEIGDQEVESNVNMNLKDETLSEKYENFNPKDSNVLDFEEEKKTEEEDKKIIEESVNNLNQSTNKSTNRTKRISGTNKYTFKNLNLDNIKKYYLYVLENNKDSKVDGYKKIAETLGFTQGESLRIFNFLRDFGYLKTKEKTTKLTKKTDVNLISEDLNSLDTDMRRASNE